MNTTDSPHMLRTARRSVQPRRRVTAIAVSVTASSALFLAGCTGAPKDSSTPTIQSSSSPSSSSDAGADPQGGTTSLEDAGMKAGSLTDGSTVISIEAENQGMHWEVKVATGDGVVYETLLNVSDGSVVRGPDKKNGSA